MSDMRERSILTEVLPDQGPGWLSALCKHRMLLDTAILCSDVNGSLRYWRFMYASLKPVAISILPLRKVPSSEQHLSLRGCGRDGSHHLFNQTHFQHHLGHFETGSVWRDINWESMRIYAESFFGIDGILI
eukprot:6456569-Amphidinium_carterae.1